MILDKRLRLSLGLLARLLGLLQRERKDLDKPHRLVVFPRSQELEAQVAKEWWKENWKQTIQGMLLERDWYLEKVGHFPKEYEDGSEGHKQWSYNPRTKKSREYFAQTYEQKLPLRPKQGKTRLRKKAD